MQLRFLRLQAEADDAASFIFQPLEPVRWLAGQSIKLSLPSGFAASERRFTIASAPSEDVIMITTRNSGSPFKRTLFGLPPGSLVEALAVDGSFVWPPDDVPPILCASGIGITPFRSMLMERAANGLSLTAALYYASRSSDFIFENELRQLGKQHAGLQLYFYPRQRLKAELVVPAALREPMWPVYIAGPPAMVDELSASLVAAGVTEDRLRHDWFTGRLPADA